MKYATLQEDQIKKFTIIFIRFYKIKKTNLKAFFFVFTSTPGRRCYKKKQKKNVILKY